MNIEKHPSTNVFGNVLPFQLSYRKKKEDWLTTSTNTPGNINHERQHHLEFQPAHVDKISSAIASPGGWWLVLNTAQTVLQGLDQNLRGLWVGSNGLSDESHCHTQHVHCTLVLTCTHTHTYTWYTILQRKMTHHSASILTESNLLCETTTQQEISLK